MIYIGDLTPCEFEECILYSAHVECGSLQMSVVSSWLMVLFSNFLLIFHLLYISITERGVLISPVMKMDVSICSFSLESCIFFKKISRCGVILHISYYQINSAVQFCLTLCDPMDCSMPGFPIHHQHTDLAKIHAYRVSDAIQLSH